MKKYLQFLLPVIYIIPVHLFAQEIVVPLDYNPSIKNYIAKNGMQAAKRAQVLPGDTLSLPFNDDFSESGIYPSSSRWMDNKVFINSDLPRVMPTVGAATFDGLDEFGNAYLPGSSISASCDVLTSKPLFLFTNFQSGTNYQISDSIYISFYFEKKGYGDAPEVSDSLILEYYRPSLQAWTREWFSLGGVTAGQDTVFNQVILKITNPDYLQDGFQFRFRNYGNPSGSLDNWHVDYVRVFASAVPAPIVDYAFTNNRNNALVTFTSIPWKHYKVNSNPSALMKSNETISYIVYRDLPNVSAGFNHRAYGPGNVIVGSIGNTGVNAVPPYQRLDYTYAMNYVFPNNIEVTDDSSYFDLVDYFNTPQGGDIILSNDTIHYHQIFSDYYSYDDGTCELGYDLINAANGKIAMRFDMLQSDTLRGVRIFFTQQNGVVNTKLINIKVWSSLSPEVLLFQLPNQLPAYVDSINGFATYIFNTPVPASGFYIGFQQVSPDGLHLGFDRNTASNSKMFYNTSGTWSQVSVLPGSFMIRPVIGDFPLVGISTINHAPSLINCYPNPTSGELYIYTDNDKLIYNKVTVTDVTGRVVFVAPYSPGKFDLSALKSGIYTVQLSGDEIVSTAQKLVINNK
ncbi:MAG: T9SS type A sorting domain-containing protein [Bacteroidota bacterium]